MKSIRQRLYFYAAAATLGVVACVLIFIKAVVSGHNAEIMLTVVITVTILLTGFSAREYKRLKAARLIIENQILHIQPAVIDAGDRGKEAVDSPSKTIEVFISCFGILLDSKIIKFNQEGVHLKNVEIGRDFICLTYGTDRRTQKTRLLHAQIDNRELNNIVEKFRYETGVVPIITD